MRFRLVDHVIEQAPDRVRTIKHVSAAEEYLADHFPTFPVLPGVMMLEALVESARLLLASRSSHRLVLAEVRAKLGAAGASRRAANAVLHVAKKAT